MSIAGFKVIQAVDVEKLQEALDLFVEARSPLDVRTSMTSVLLEDGSVLHTLVIRYS